MTSNLIFNYEKWLICIRFNVDWTIFLFGGTLGVNGFIYPFWFLIFLYFCSKVVFCYFFEVHFWDLVLFSNLEFSKTLQWEFWFVDWEKNSYWNFVCRSLLDLRGWTLYATRFSWLPSTSLTPCWILNSFKLKVSFYWFLSWILMKFIDFCCLWLAIGFRCFSQFGFWILVKNWIYCNWNLKT